MAFNLKKEGFKKELQAGIYPLVISDVRTYMEGGNIAQYAGGPGIILKFATADNRVHEELFWVNSGHYKRFQKVMQQCGLSPSEKHKKGDLIGKRIWGYVCEVRTVDGAGTVSDNKEYSMFNTSPFITGDKPVHKDDPERHNGQVMGEFIQYLKIEGTFAAEMDFGNISAELQTTIPIPQNFNTNNQDFNNMPAF